MNYTKFQGGVGQTVFEIDTVCFQNKYEVNEAIPDKCQQFAICMVLMCFNHLLDYQGISETHSVVY